jgi:hypothetical protein
LGGQGKGLKEREILDILLHVILVIRRGYLLFLIGTSFRNASSQIEIECWLALRTPAWGVIFSKVRMSALTPIYDLTFEERVGYLYAKVRSTSIDRDVAMAYLTEVAERAKAIKAERLMLHRDIPVMLPDGVLFFVTNEFQQMIAGIKTAFVNPYLSNAEAFRFAITVGTNRGAYYSVFTNDADAEIWLLRKS